MSSTSLNHDATTHFTLLFKLNTAREMFKIVAWQGWGCCSSMPSSPTCLEPDLVFAVGTCTQSTFTNHKHMRVQGWPSRSQTHTQRPLMNTSSAAGLIFLLSLTEQCGSLLEGKYTHMYAQCSPCSSWAQTHALASSCPWIPGFPETDNWIYEWRYGYTLSICW